MEYFPLRDLKRHIKARIVDEEEAKKIVYDLLVGLKIMHAEGIVHRDLKPEVRWYIFISLLFARFRVRSLSFSNITNCVRIFSWPLNLQSPAGRSRLRTSAYRNVYHLKES